MREIDQKNYILLALYVCSMIYTGFGIVNELSKEMPGEVFDWNLYKLQMEGMITGCEFVPMRPGELGTIEVMRDMLLLTPDGFKAAQTMLGSDNEQSRILEIRKILPDADTEEDKRQFGPDSADNDREVRQMRPDVWTQGSRLGYNRGMR